MRVWTEFNVTTFHAWSGAIDTQKRIIEEGKADEFNALTDEIFPDGLSETEMNDFLWFDRDSIYRQLKINGEEEEW